MSKKPPLILVDGSSYLFRAFHALPPLSTSDGQPTGAIKGVVSMLRSLLKTYGPSHMAVVFDAKGKTFRNDMYPEYKANRPPMPDELRAQIEPLHEVVKAMGLPLIVEEGVEADDVIGTLAEEAGRQGIETVISTGDKDMAQLVNEHVTLINTMTNTIMDREAVTEKFGVPPEGIVDYLALVGDKVDNVPGVEKCGPKTAVKWLTEYGTMEGVMENADNIKGKVGENLKAALDRLPLSKELVTIKLDCELKESLDDLEIAAPDEQQLVDWYRKLEFKSWLSELLEGGVVESAGEDGTSPSLLDPASYETIFEKAELERWIKKLGKAKVFAFDTETTSLQYMDAEIVGVSFALDDAAAYVPVAHSYAGAPDQLDRDEVLAMLKPLLEAKTPGKIGQHLKYDKNVLANYDINLQGIAFDTMLESYVLDSVATRHDMDSLSLKYLGHKTVHYEDIAGKGAKQIGFDQVAIEQAAPYAAEDADVTLKLHQVLWPRLEKEEPLRKVFETIEMPLVEVLSTIERNGAYVDAAMLKKQSGELAVRMMDIEKQAYEIAGQEFNLGSPKQLGEIMYDKLDIPVIKKTPKGAPSTAEAVLQELALEHELPRVIMEYRGLSKLRSTYTDKLPEMINARTGRLHTSYHQAVTATGRLSSTDPNLQNIPVRSEEGRKIRQAFHAEKGGKIVAADYSQIELRIMAHLSRDKGLLDAFREGKDIHRATAAEVTGVALEEVDAEQRRRAKAVNFGLIYGMSAFGLAKQLGIKRDEAQAYIDMYFDRYPGVLKYMDETRASAADRGYVETLFGRRLYLPEINVSNAMRRQAAERTAINAPMQGTAADIIKLAMIRVFHKLEEQKLAARMIMQVHDELVFEVEDNELEQLASILKEEMPAAATLEVPLVVDVGVGDNWDEAH